MKVKIAIDTPEKSGFALVRLTIRFIGICSELTLGQLWASYSSLFVSKSLKKQCKVLSGCLKDLSRGIIKQIMTWYMWHVICAIWHVTLDTWQVENIVSKFRSLALTVWQFWCFEDWEGKGHWSNELINELVTGVLIERPRLHRVC